MTGAKRTSSRTVVALATITPLAVAALVGLYFWLREPAVTIGVEGRRVVEIAGPLLRAAPFTPGDAVSLRIAEAVPTDRGHRYDLRYIAYGPGEHDLAKHLQRDDGEAAANLPTLAIDVASILPAKHGGELFDAPGGPIDLHSNYSLTMRLLWGLWAVALVPLLLYGRRRRAVVEQPAPPPTVAQRLRDLLERAAVEHLSPAEQADLEQLLLAFWSQRLNLDAERLSDAIESLRNDPTAGRQLAGVERWLHSRSAPANGAAARELLNELSKTSPSEFRLPGGERRR